MKRISKVIILLLGFTHVAQADIYVYISRIFNLVTGSAVLIPGIKVEGQGAGFITQDANKPWVGVGPNGKNYNVSTLNYSYHGVVTLTVDASFYNSLGNGCVFLNDNQTSNKQLYVGWTVMQPGVSGNIVNTLGALYANGFGAGVSAQTNWRGIDGGQPQFNATYSNSSLSAEVYVSNGPAGIYTMPGGKQVYVHTAGQSPNAVPYADIYGLDCHGGSVLGVGVSIPTTPIEPPDPDITCTFSVSGPINLGSMDVTNALGRKGSTVLTTQCSGDTSVKGTIRAASGKDNIIQLAGLTIPVTFSNGTNQVTYSANTGTTTQTINAEVTGASGMVPGSYSESMVIYLDYD